MMLRLYNGMMYDGYDVRRMCYEWLSHNRCSPVSEREVTQATSERGVTRALDDREVTWRSTSER